MRASVVLPQSPPVFIIRAIDLLIHTDLIVKCLRTLAYERTVCAAA